MSWWTRSGARARRSATSDGVGQDVEEVAAARVEHVQRARPGGLDHLARPSARARPAPGSPTLRELAAADSGGRPARRRGRRWRRRPSRRRPARRNARGSASARRPGRPTLPRARARLMQRPHVVGAEGVLGDPHRPDEDGRVGGRVHARRTRSMSAAGARSSAQLGQGRGERTLAQVVEAGRVVGDEVARRGRPSLDQHLQHAVRRRPRRRRCAPGRTRRSCASRTARSRRSRAPSSARGRARGTG